MFIHIEGAEDCRQVDKIKMHNVVTNDTGSGPFVRSLIYNWKAYSIALYTGAVNECT